MTQEHAGPAAREQSTDSPRTIHRAALGGLVLCALAGTLAACSAASESSAPPPAVEAPRSVPQGTQADTPGVVGLVDETETGFAPVGQSEACAIERADTVQFKEPVDIILIIDNSASMAEEFAATERNINGSFASILQGSGLDYRLIVLTLHRRFRREGQAATMLCVTEPLSGLDDCTSADEPRFTDHFFQYSTRIESDDSFDVLLDTFAPPFGEDREDEFGNAPLGWSEWLRPGIKKVFLEITDDDEDMPATEFTRALTELSPADFGADAAHPSFVFHSIVGLAEKQQVTEAYQASEAVQPLTCIKNFIAVPRSGEVYQELSRLTGGLRFPICQSSLYDVVFREIAGKVIAQSNIACDFPVPMPPAGRTLDLDRVSISIDHELTLAPTTTLGQTRLATDCAEDAFFIEEGRIQLCPQVCSAVRGEEGARVDVLFGCESTIIVR